MAELPWGVFLYCGEAAHDGMHDANSLPLISVSAAERGKADSIVNSPVGWAQLLQREFCLHYEFMEDVVGEFEISICVADCNFFQYMILHKKR